MSDISGVIEIIFNELESRSVDWQSFSLVIQLDDEGDVSGNSGYAYTTDGGFSAFSKKGFSLDDPVRAYLSDIYGDTPFPISMLLQFDRSTGQFKTLFEDKDTSRWAVTPADIHGYIDRMRPRFDD